MKFAICNLGCKVNNYESNWYRQQLSKQYQEVDFKEFSDIYIINSCTVTNMAGSKTRQMMHKARKQNPDSCIVVVGCYVQMEFDDPELFKDCDILIGSKDKTRLPELIDQFFIDGKRVTLVQNKDKYPFEEMFITDFNQIRAYLKIQDGCNQFCSYCIIPFTRGRVRSRRPEDVETEILGLCEAGYQEFVLTGIHLSSYGVDFSEDKKPRLLELIQKIDAISGVKRIRLGSLEPGIITEEFADALRMLPSFCPHFHLSLQSGCDATLKRMNRRYTASEYEEKCIILRSVFDKPALTTDVIVGFPGETDGDFEECRSFLENIAFYETHIFKYSRRQGTKAAAMPEQIPEQIKTERSHVLLKLHEKNKTAYLEQFVGKELEVLFEEQVKIGEKTVWSGYSREYIRVLWDTEECLENRICTVTPVRADAKEGALWI